MERIIFILAFEKRWGCWMVHARRAEDKGSFFQSKGLYLGTGEELPEGMRTAVELVAKCGTGELFRQFGRAGFRDERDFLQRVELSDIRLSVRPYLERMLARVLDALAEAGCPLYLQASRWDNFYEKDRLELRPLEVHAVLRFERTGDFTRYVLQLKEEERVFYPSDYDLKVLSRRPCRVLAGRQLFRFPEDFDGRRLMPFLEKREVMIPKANEQLYFQKFILKTVRHEEIEVKGFDVIVREVKKGLRLSLERDVLGMPVLVALYVYGGRLVPFWAPRKALVELQEEGDTYAFYKINRDTAWEDGRVGVLAALGLRECRTGVWQVGGVVASASPKEQDIRAAWRVTVDWLKANGAALRQEGIVLSQRNLQQPYYLGDWEVEMSALTETDWFELKAEVRLGDGRRIPLMAFRDNILKGIREYVLDDGTVFLIPEEWFATYSGLFFFTEGQEGASVRLPRSQYALADCGNMYVTPFPADCGEAALPGGLRADLRPYQLAGYRWLYRLYRAGLGGCLADDMGLGKTLQMIALLQKYREEAVKRAPAWRQPEAGTQLSLLDAFAQEGAAAGGEGEAFRTCLVVVPASLVHNWQNELRKFAPGLTVTVYAGGHRAELRAYLQRSDVVLVTYHTLRNDIDYLERLAFGIVVADEAQMMKNPASQVHQAMMRVHGRWFFALSGTPVENSLSDLWSVMDFANRGVLGTLPFFRRYFVKSIVADLAGRKSAILKKLIAPYLLRRTKEEVLAELPDLTSELVVCEPEEEQSRLYEEEQSRVRNYILDRRNKGLALRADFMVLKALIRLRQLANHPRLVDGTYAGSAGKFREVFRMLEGVLEAGHKVLVFSSFVKHLNLVGEEAARRHWEYAMLTGSTQDRAGEIARFSREPDCRLFLISLKAGGVGLNLTEADYVFILDPWWNLAAENQAVSRAHRMGQKRAVFVYRFITADTLEEKILAVQRRKQNLADSVVTVSSAIPLSDEELLEVL